MHETDATTRRQRNHVAEARATALIANIGMMPGEPDTQQALVPRIPVGRLGTLEDVAEAILMLVVNSYITNRALLIDGGMSPHS